MSAPFEPQSPALASDASPSVRPGFASGAPPAPLGAFVPLLLVTLVLLAYFTFQATQLRAERAALGEMRVAQDKPFQDSQKMRDALEAIVRGTTQLADAGNPGARLIVDELKRRGVTFTPSQATGTTVTPPPK